MLGTAWCLYPLAVACAARTHTFVLGVASLVAGLAVVSAVPDGVSLGRWILVSGAALSVAWLLGTMVGRQILAAQQAERARVQLAVARDVHDVVGHALGVICAEAGVARFLPDAGEEELRDTLADIEAHARSALEEVQALVRGLRTEQAAPLARLSAVFTATRAAGIGVRNRVDLTRPVGDAVGTTVVRIVQEALSNVVRHAPGATCTVDVHDDGRTVAVRVHDDGPGAGVRDGGTGVGLHGIRERAGLLGGSASWGNHPDGGFEVVAHLPAGTTR
jgi:signal transduction histidine kinase